MKQNLIRITSAGTAAQKRSKCSWLARHALLLAIPMLSAVFCQAQKPDTSIFKIMSAGTMPSNISLLDDSLNTFRVYDSLKGYVVISSKDSLIVSDSLSAIENLIKISRYEFERNKTQNEKYWAAIEILSYLTVDGTVSNKKKFDAAVKEYMKLNTVSK